MINYVPIEKLLGAQRDKQWPVVLNDGSILCWHEWLSKVASWRELLGQRSEQRWALYHPDAGEFSAILFALWSLGKVAYLPGSRQPALLEALAGEVEAFVGDFDGLVSTPTISGQTHITDTERHASLAKVVIDSDSILLQVYTSGSSGKPQAIPKTIKQLSSEVKHLQTLWGKPASPSLVLATVSHQHIYGLLFRVLWPLAAGVCFDAQSCEYLEEIKFRAWQDWPLSLVSSPTHLSRIPADMDQNTLQKLGAIFSSGAPLKHRDSLLAYTRLGTPVSEVYGSSETGGIAWRQQTSEHEALWQAMPGVKTRMDSQQQCLQVCSQHLPASIDWQQTADRVLFNAKGEFSLLGRVDRIVKVEGKRASLDEIEAWLLKHPTVQSIRLVMLEGQRAEIAGAVVLSADAKKELARHGKRHINEQLKSHCAQRFERPLLPRRWRYIEQLPVNSQGKFEQQKFLALFDKKPDDRPRLPVELQREYKADGKLNLHLHVPKELLFFDGHFDKIPILPGVVQIYWANHYARQAFSLEDDFLRLEVIKFKQIIHPGQDVTLALSYHAPKHRIDFIYYSDEGQHASGRIVLGKAT